MRRSAAVTLSALLLSALLAWGTAEPGRAAGAGADLREDGAGEGPAEALLPVFHDEEIAAADGQGEAAAHIEAEANIIIEAMPASGEGAREAAPEPRGDGTPDADANGAAPPADTEAAWAQSAEKDAEADPLREAQGDRGAGAAKPDAPADGEACPPDRAAAPDSRTEPGESRPSEETAAGPEPEEESVPADAAAEGPLPEDGRSEASALPEPVEEAIAGPEPEEESAPADAAAEGPLPEGGRSEASALPEPAQEEAAFALRARMEPLALLPLPGGCRLLEEPRLWLEAENLSDAPLRLRIAPTLSEETAALYRALGAEPFGEPVFLALAAGERLGLWLAMPLREGALCPLDPRGVDASHLAFELRASAEAARP